MSENQSFSYVIVGAGSAGCVLAARLSENPKFSMLIGGRPTRSEPVDTCTNRVR